MTDRELDALIAERVMGWVKFYPQDQFWTLPNGVQLPDGEFWPPPYSTDRNAAAEVLDRIGELGMGFDYQRRLQSVLGLMAGGIGLDKWDYITAAPRQLMEAALACIATASAGEG